MAHTAVVTFTARNAGWIVQEGGSQAWRLDADRARRSEYLVCTQNRHNTEGFGDPKAEHGAAFLIGRIADVVPALEDPGRNRWLITISEYTECDIRNIWRKSGHRRYPVWYTTLEALGIDLADLPPFRPLPSSAGADGFAEALAAPIAPREWPTASPGRAWQPTEPAPGRPAGDVPLTTGAWHTQRLAAGPAFDAAGGPARPIGPDGAEAWARLDAILAQLDRVPDLPAPADPLDWDAHGLPR